MNQPPVLLWFRRDLRLSDNPALAAALREASSVIPVFIWDEADSGTWPCGAASKVWLAESLKSLQTALRQRQSNLIIRSGKTRDVLASLAQETGARVIHCNARYEPWAQTQQSQLQSQLANENLQLHVHTGSYLLWEPAALSTGAGNPYQVYTPFLKRCLAQLPDLPPVSASNTPNEIDAFSSANSTTATPVSWPTSIEIGDLGLLPKIPWDQTMRRVWQPGELGAQKRLQQFTSDALASYADGRDRPSVEGTSRLSPSLHFGEITPRQIWNAVSEHSKSTGVTTYLKEIVWREFAYHVLHHFPHLPERCLKPQFEQLAWQSRPQCFEAWTQGQTGYPIVDAGMRQLWQTGWMHNRVRMIVGSFLTKHLLLPWQDGERWFWDTLVDADLAANSFNWQWIAGCGADASPFFRIFNPVLQGEKFDPDGLYIHQWVPELSNVPAKWIHQPWNAPPLELHRAGIILGKTYPHPIVDHNEARYKALAAYQQIKKI